jgi:PAS domain S-box-containing protein
LIGLDGEWSPWTKNIEKEYTQLYEGLYSFELKARNVYGEESSIQFIQFEVLPPWYRSFLSYLSYLFALVLLIIVSIRLNTRRLIRDKLRLEAIVEERTQEIQAQKEAILKQATELKIKNLELLKLSKVASESTNAISIFSQEGEVLWVNRAYNEMYGHNLDSFSENEYGNLLKDSMNPDIAETVADCILNKKSVSYECKCRRTDGQYIWSHTTLTNVTDSDTNTSYFIAIESDITSIKEANDEILEQKSEIESQRDELERVNAMKDKFFSVIAHDLRNPVATMVGFTNVLNKDFNSLSQDKTEKAIEILGERSRNMLNLLENLLDWARCQTGKVIYNPENNNLASLIKECVEIMKPDLELKKQKLRLDLDEDVPVFADENMLKTILRNLIGNANKYTPVEGEISISAKIIDGKAYFNISDSGIGMDEQTKSNILSNQVNLSQVGTNNEKGTGIGLLLCKEFVDLNNGELKIESEKDKGTSFEFYFPSYVEEQALTE